jgi:hypothetical protein
LGLCAAMPKGATIPAINSESILARALVAQIAQMTDTTIELGAERAVSK